MTKMQIVFLIRDSEKTLQIVQCEAEVADGYAILENGSEFGPVDWTETLEDAYYRLQKRVESKLYNVRREYEELVSARLAIVSKVLTVVKVV